MRRFCSEWQLAVKALGLPRERERLVTQVVHIWVVNVSYFLSMCKPEEYNIVLSFVHRTAAGSYEDCAVQFGPTADALGQQACCLR